MDISHLQALSFAALSAAVVIVNVNIILRREAAHRLVKQSLAEETIQSEEAGMNKELEERVDAWFGGENG